MKKYSLKEAWAFGKDRTFGPPSFDGRLDAGYGTLKQTMKPQKMANGFPYDIHKNKEDINADDNGFIDDIDNISKFLSKTNNTTPQHSFNSKADQKSFIDGETRGISDSVLKNYIKTIMEFALTMKPKSSRSDFVINQFGDKVLDGTIAGWSRAYPFEDEESEERSFSFADLIKNHKEKEGLV